MKRLISLFIFLTCLFSYMSVSFAVDNYFDGNWIVPVANMKGGWEVTSPYGLRERPKDGASNDHQGMDIAASGTGYCGGNAIAAAAGTVYSVEWQSGYGLCVFVSTPHPQFPEGLIVLYAHGARALVSEGQTVSQGTPLTEIEDEDQHGTGLGYDQPHLHFEIRTSYDGETLDPALFVPELQPYASGESMKVGVPYRVPSEGGSFAEFKQILFEFKYEMVKGFREIFENIAKAIIAGLKNIHSVVRRIFIILIMIDLALGTMFRSFFSSDDESIVRYILFKFLFYGMMFLLIENFADLANHFVKDWFIAGTGKAMSMEEAEVVRLISDPMLIIEKGLHIIQPIINSALSFSFPESLADWVIFLLPGSSILSLVLLIVGILVFLILLCMIAFLITLAYLEFYLFILFGFTTMIFAGTRQTRQLRLANRGLTAVFAGALNLMFYIMLTVILSQSLVAIANQAQQTNVTISKDIDGVPISSADDLRNRIRAMETGTPANYLSIGGGDPHSDNTNAEYYGAFHIKVSDWNSWCEEAFNDGAPLTKSENGGSYPTPDSKYKWTPENQEALVLWKLKKDYESMGNWEQVAQEFYNHSGPHDKAFSDYWNTIIKKPLNNQKQRIRTGTNNILVVIQLNICLIVFVFLAIRMSNSIRALFKGGGFELLNSRHE